MNISRINNTQQSFTGNFSSKIKNTTFALATATAILSTLPKANGQINFPSAQPGAIPTEDWYTMYERQRSVHGIVSYIDQFGQKYVDESDYVNLQIKYDELIKSMPQATTESKSIFTKNTRQKLETNKQNKAPFSVESIKRMAESEQSTAHNFITIGALILGFLLGPSLIQRILKKVIK